MLACSSLETAKQLSEGDAMLLSPPMPMPMPVPMLCFEANADSDDVGGEWPWMTFWLRGVLLSPMGCEKMNIGYDCKLCSTYYILYIIHLYNIFGKGNT